MKHPTQAKHFTLKANQLQRGDLQEFVGLLRTALEQFESIQADLSQRAHP